MTVIEAICKHGLFNYEILAAYWFKRNLREGVEIEAAY